MPKTKITLTRWAQINGINYATAYKWARQSGAPRAGQGHIVPAPTPCQFRGFAVDPDAIGYPGTSGRPSGNARKPKPRQSA